MKIFLAILGIIALVIASIKMMLNRPHSTEHFWDAWTCGCLAAFIFLAASAFLFWIVVFAWRADGAK